MRDYCSSPGKKSCGKKSCGLGYVSEVKGHQKLAGFPPVWNVKFEREDQDDSRVFGLSNC